MSSKENFIKEMENIFERYQIELSSDAQTFFNSLKEKPKDVMTKNGALILGYMKEIEADNLKCKDIAEGMNISSRSVSGSLRKLVSDGYVEKVGQEPVVYSLTEKGRNIDFASDEIKRILEN